MSERIFSKRMIGIALALVVIGALCWGAAGVLAGYYLAFNQMQTQATAALTSAPLAPGTGSVVSNLSAGADSAVVDTVKKAEPAVVTIMSAVQSQARGYRGGPAIAEGSGVIIDNQGHIVTNAHVVNGARQIQVTFDDGTRATAQLVGADTTNDIAVLKVSTPVPAYLSLGNSDQIQLGESVLAIGNPLGNYTGTVTLGIVSGLNRSVSGSGLDNLIQTDAAINHGNSGGPLLDLNGQVIGINSLVVENTNSGDFAQGLGFAIPSNTVANIAQQIIANAQ